MKFKLFKILALLSLDLSSAYSQNFEPLDLAKKIFSKDSLINLSPYVTGEYKGHPNGQDLPEGSTINFKLLAQNNKHAVVAITVLDSIGIGLDAYLHFVKDSVWKATAFRSLSMLETIELRKIELEKLTPKQVQDIIQGKKKNKQNEYFVFRSWADYEYQLGNAKLTIDLDDDIIKHFLKNKNEFERIKNLVLADLDQKGADEECVKLSEGLERDCQKIFISGILRGDDEFGYGLKFLIGGVVDNTVGYLYLKDKKYLPEMDPHRIIMLREIGDGWYIYKTT